jgi:hypothetical protein
MAHAPSIQYNYEVPLGAVPGTPGRPLVLLVQRFGIVPRM